ncbi:hypothetical protein Holit_03210 [Hollandina sp. SP2]
MGVKPIKNYQMSASLAQLQAKQQAMCADGGRGKGIAVPCSCTRSTNSTVSECCCGTASKPLIDFLSYENCIVQIIYSLF